jgi:hypothetical protein
MNGRRSLSRWMVAAVTAVLLAAPAGAAERRPSPRTGLAAALDAWLGGLLGWVGGWGGGLQNVSADHGHGIDPDGQPLTVTQEDPAGGDSMDTDHGHGIDPNG